MANTMFFRTTTEAGRVVDSLITIRGCNYYRGLKLVEINGEIDEDVMELAREATEEWFKLFNYQFYQIVVQNRSTSYERNFSITIDPFGPNFSDFACLYQHPFAEIEICQDTVLWRRQSHSFRLLGRNRLVQAKYATAKNLTIEFEDSEGKPVRLTMSLDGMSEEESHAYAEEMVNRIQFDRMLLINL